MSTSTNLQNEIVYTTNAQNYAKIPGMPVAYWVSEAFLKMFENPLFYEMSISDGKNVTGNNDKYLRMIWEVPSTEVGIGKHYLKYLKGGTFRKWYGNIDYVIDWSEQAQNHYHRDTVSRIIPEYLWYKIGISWTLITSGTPGFRIKPIDSTFDGGGLTIFLKNDRNIYYYISMFNSCVFPKIEEVLNPTLNLLIKDIRSIPMIIDEKEKTSVEALAVENIGIAQDDWDLFETSWDFKKHPLL